MDFYKRTQWFLLFMSKLISFLNLIFKCVFKKNTLPCIHPYVMAPLLQINDYKFAWLVHLDSSLSAKLSILLFHVQWLVIVLKHSLKLLTKNYIFTFCKLYIVKTWNINKYTKALQCNISKPVILFKTLVKA